MVVTKQKPAAVTNRQSPVSYRLKSLTTPSDGGDVAQGASTFLHEDILPSNTREAFADGH